MIAVILVFSADSIGQEKLIQLKNRYSPITLTVDPHQQDFQPFRFVIYGDTRYGNQVHQEIVRSIIADKPELVVHVGDVINYGNKLSEWEMFLSITRELRATIPFYIVRGNHESHVRTFLELFDLPDRKTYYAFSYKGIRFIILDSTIGLWRQSEQVKWLIRELESVPSGHFKVIFLHHPIFIPFRKDLHLVFRQSIEPILEEYGVNLVVSGHEHYYEHLEKNGIAYLISGGGGSPLDKKGGRLSISKHYASSFHHCVVDVQESGLLISVYGLERVLIDRFTIHPHADQLASLKNNETAIRITENDRRQMPGRRLRSRSTVSGALPS